MDLYAKSYPVCDFCERRKKVNILEELIETSIEHFWEPGGAGENLKEVDRT